MFYTRLQYPKDHPINLIAKIIINSLYGRFGMRDNFSICEVIDIKDYPTYEKNNIDSIEDVSFLDEEFFNNKVLVNIKSPDVERDTMLDNGSEIHNVNIAIAAAITAYARIKMANLIKYLLDNDYILYYKDTDSIHINKELPECMVSDTELGQLKLENKIKKAIYLAPKVYAILTEDDKLICKVKGLNKDINLSLDDFENLLVKDSKLEKEQVKWFRSIEDSTISIKNQLYTLSVTGNKRENIYENNVFVDTKPFKIDNDKTIK